MSDDRKPYRTCVVTWYYSDNSAYGVVGVYRYESRAKAICDYLNSENGVKSYRVHPVDEQPEVSKP